MVPEELELGGKIESQSLMIGSGNRVTILISPYRMSQPACLEGCFYKKSASVQRYGCSQRKRPFVTLFDFFLPLKLGNELFNQFADPLGANLSIAVIFAIISFVSKYTKNDM